MSSTSSHQRISKADAGRRVRLRPANPFDLIRLIAHSQSDPRKAVAELVQNSFDAEARNVVVTRQRRRSEVTIAVLDDGRGVFPDLERPEALRRIATNIGHSFKCNFSPAERQRQMMLGKYGIGMLGFWCVGREMEMRSRVAGSDVWVLRLVRDNPVAEVRRARQPRIPFGETWTEVVIHGVHPGPARQLSARRLGEYLGAELRGQLLAREVKLRMVDRLARSPGLKDFLVIPQRFHGRRLTQLGDLPVPDFVSATIELYLVDPDDDRRPDGAVQVRPMVALASGGTVVCDDLGALEGYGLDVGLWSSGRFEGVVEFAALDVAPGTRRGFTPSPAADALVAALLSIEPTLRRILDEELALARDEQDANLAHEIRRVFRPLVKTLPQYDFFEIAAHGRDREGNGRPQGERLGSTASAIEPVPPATAPLNESDAAASEFNDSTGETEPSRDLFAPGPLHAVHVTPRKSRLLPGASRVLTAKAIDEHGQPVSENVSFIWGLVEGEGTIRNYETAAPCETRTDGDTGDHEGALEQAIEGQKHADFSALPVPAVVSSSRAVFTASRRLGPVRVGVTARQADCVCDGTAEIEIVDRLAGENPDAGIPDPQRAFDPNGDWRSRVLDGRWEYNAAHPDYRAVADDPKARLRYLVHLFAKEIVLHNYGEPNDDRLLERMVEVLTHIRSRA